MQQIILLLLRALLLTCAAESLVLIWLRPRRLWLVMGLLCNIATNPLLNVLRLLAMPILSSNGLTALTLMLECAAVLAEAGLYRLGTGVRFQQCLLVSLGCNLLSYTVGLLCAGWLI